MTVTSRSNNDARRSVRCYVNLAHVTDQGFVKSCNGNVAHIMSWYTFVHIAFIAFFKIDLRLSIWLLYRDNVTSPICEQCKQKLSVERHLARYFYIERRPILNLCHLPRIGELRAGIKTTGSNISDYNLCKLLFLQTQYFESGWYLAIFGEVPNIFFQIVWWYILDHQYIVWFT